jgi:hypothetical protein
MLHLLLTMALVAADPEPLKFPPLQVYRHRYAIERTYDRFKDHTLLDLNLDDDTKRQEPPLSMSLFYFSKGVTRGPMKSGETIHFMLATHGKEWRYLTYRRLILLVDGERMDLDEPTHSGDVVSGGVREIMQAHLSRQQLLQLANARRVEVELGSTQFDLSAERLVAIKDFAARLGVDSEAAERIAAERIVAQQDARNAVAQAVQEARTAAKKISPKFAATRQKTYDRVLKEKLDAVCAKYKLTLADAQKMAAQLKEKP